MNAPSLMKRLCKMKVEKLNIYGGLFVLAGVLYHSVSPSFAFNDTAPPNSPPLFIWVFLMLMSLYHSTLHTTIKEVQNIAPSDVWETLKKANLAGFFLTLATALLLNELFKASGSYIAILIVAAAMDVLTHYFANLTVYYLVKQIGKTEINIFRRGYTFFHILFALTFYVAGTQVFSIPLPAVNSFNVLFIFVIISLFVVFYSLYSLVHISRSYSRIGFVSRPFLIGGLGMLFEFVSILLITFYILELETAQLFRIYYVISFYIVFLLLTVSYFMPFFFNYPGLLEVKWKRAMHLDPPKIMTALTLAFLAMSLYFTNDGAQIFSKTAPLAYFVVLIFTFLTVAVLNYSKAFAERTTLKYWTYLKTEMAAFLVLTFYVMTTGILLWNVIDAREKWLYVFFVFFSALFFYASVIDIKALTKELKIKTKVHIIDLIRYSLSIFSLFFINLFILGFTEYKTTQIDLFLQKYPNYPFLLVGIFLIFYALYLQYSHRGFEELMTKSFITNITYMSSLAAFVLFLFIYREIANAENGVPFPFFSTVFFGYFLVLIVDVYSISTLRIDEYEKEAKKDLEYLLKNVTQHFFRTDVLVNLLTQVQYRHKNINPEVENISFYPKQRNFDLKHLDKDAKRDISIELLLGMEKLILKKSEVAVRLEYNIRREIESILGENLLLLPEDFLREFNIEKTYTRLLEKTLNRINLNIQPFIPHKDYGRLLEKLVEVNAFFEYLSYNEEGVKIKENIEITRGDFIEHLKIFVKAIEEVFPFNRLLLREALKLEVDQRLFLYGFTQGDILDLVPTGAAELDNILYGGLIRGTSTLFLSEERRAKDDLLFLFAGTGLKEGVRVIFATSRRDTVDVEKDLKRFAGSVKNLVLIDLFRSIHTDRPVDRMSVKGSRRIAPASLIQFRREVVSAIKSLPTKTHKRVVLDVYNDLSKYQKNEDIQDLITRQSSGFKKRNCTSIIAISPSLSSEELEKHFDNVFVLVDTSTIEVKKLFGGRPKRAVFTLWESYSPIEKPGYSLFLERR